MNESDVYKRYLSAKKRYEEELSDIQKEYISTNCHYKKGDVVRYKDRFLHKPVILVIDNMYFGNLDKGYGIAFKNPRVIFSGHQVDENGYDMTYFADTKQTIGYSGSVEDIIEVMKIRPKGLR